jgi:hypothetical protein
MTNDRSTGRGRRERPIPPGPLNEFAQGLRDLRASAGQPTYRALERRAGYSSSALSAAAAGERLPSLAVTLAYVGACDGDMAAWEVRWELLAAQLRRAEGSSSAEADARPARVFAALTRR